MAHLRYNGLSSDGSAGTITLTGAGTTATFVNPLPGVATIVVPDVLILTIAASTPFEEIIALTAYTAGATTATCVRNYEATVEGQNSSAAHTSSTWSHDAVASDYAGNINEVASTVLVNAVSAGAAGPIADHFDSAVLNAAWINEGGAATFVTGRSTMGYLTNAGGAALLRPWTPTGPFRIEARLHGGEPYGQLGLMVKDSGTGDVTGNGIMVEMVPANTQMQYYVLGGGTYTNTVNTVMRNYAGGWFYLRVDRDGSNNWAAYYSVDRLTWVPCGTTASLAVTVAKVGFRSDDAGAACDFIDVVL